MPANQVANLIYARALAIEAGAELARCDDAPAAVMAAAAPLLEFINAHDGPGDLAARAAAVAVQLAAFKRSVDATGQPATGAPDKFAAAAATYYAELAAPPAPAVPAARGRLMWLVRNLLLAATEPGLPGDLSEAPYLTEETGAADAAWSRVIDAAVRYGRHADDPATAEEYDRAVRLIFHGDPRLPERPGTPGTAATGTAGLPAGWVRMTRKVQPADWAGYGEEPRWDLGVPVDTGSGTTVIARGITTADLNAMYAARLDTVYLRAAPGTPAAPAGPPAGAWPTLDGPGNRNQDAYGETAAGQ